MIARHNITDELTLRLLIARIPPQYVMRCQYHQQTAANPQFNKCIIERLRIVHILGSVDSGPAMLTVDVIPMINDNRHCRVCGCGTYSHP